MLHDSDPLMCWHVDNIVASCWSVGNKPCTGMIDTSIFYNLQLRHCQLYTGDASSRVSTMPTSVKLVCQTIFQRKTLPSTFPASSCDNVCYSTMPEQDGGSVRKKGSRHQQLPINGKKLMTAF
eukprot:358229-Chlamydomonas_euryale.AAC.4